MSEVDLVTRFRAIVHTIADPTVGRAMESAIRDLTALAEEIATTQIIDLPVARVRWARRIDGGPA